jgi:hypothetical protein
MTQWLDACLSLWDDGGVIDIPEIGKLKFDPPSLRSGYGGTRGKENKSGARNQRSDGRREVSGALEGSSAALPVESTDQVTYSFDEKFVGLSAFQNFWGFGCSLAQKARVRQVFETRSPNKLERVGTVYFYTATARFLHLTACGGGS